MTEENKKTLIAQWTALDQNEKSKLLKRASANRKRDRRQFVRQTNDSDDGSGFVSIRKGPTLQELAMRLMAVESPIARTTAPDGVAGQIVHVDKAVCHVQIGDSVQLCRLSKQLVQTQQSHVAVGDMVAVVDRGGGDPFVETVLPRRTFLSRPDPGNAFRERVIVANVDRIVIVVAVVSPPLHPRLIDRFLVAIQRGGAKATICVNKIDLLENRSELDRLAPYHRLGLAVVECSTVSGRGIDDLRQSVSREVCAFVGHSGVGKSALLNALKPELALRTGSVSEGYGRGTHTTTASTMWDIGDGTRVVDTPGIRSFGLFKLKTHELAMYFDDVAALAGDCKYRDCTHTHEPICAVKAAVESGAFDRDRYDTYIRLRNSL